VKEAVEQINLASVRLGGEKVRVWLNFLAVKERFGDAVDYLESLEVEEVKLEVVAKNDFGNALYNVAKLGEGDDALKLLGLILANGGDVNQMMRGVTPLYVAAQNNRVVVVRALLERQDDIKSSVGRKVKATGFTPLEIAKKVGNKEIAKLLLREEGGEGEVTKFVVEGEDWFKAAEEGKLEVVRAFIEVGGRDLDEKGENGWTALYFAANEGHLDIVKVLVQAGAGVDVTNNYGNTPLHKAAYSGNLEVCKYLVEDGKASVNKTADNSLSPLIFATDMNHTAVIAYLKSKGGTM